VFLGDQPYKYEASTLMTEAETVFETLEWNSMLIRLIAPEDFHAIRRRESSTFLNYSAHTGDNRVGVLHAIA
jgi:hypothetical protein